MMQKKDSADLMEKYRNQHNDLMAFKELVTSQLQKEFDTISEALRGHQILHTEAQKQTLQQIENVKLELNPFKEQVNTLNKTLNQIKDMKQGYDQLHKLMESTVE